MPEIDFVGCPAKPLDALLKTYNSKMYLIMDDVLSSNRAYRLIFQDILDILKHGFEQKEIRTRPIKFKFHRDDKKIYTMEIRHLLSNLIIWRPFIDIDKVDILDASYIYDFTTFNINTLKTYINTKILSVHDGDFASKNVAIDDIGYAIKAIAHAFCNLFGISISIHNLVAMEKRIPEVGLIIREQIPDGLPPHDVELFLNERTERLIYLVTHDTEDNDLKPLFLAGKNLSTGQFREFMIHIGLKADINGNTIPILINDSFLMTGLTKPSTIYINGLGGRKALMMSKLAMGRPGAFAKLLSQNTTTGSILRQDKEMCDSIATVDYHIVDDNFLRLLNGRYYYDQYGVMQIVDYYSDKELIGKVVRFKSPATCSSDDGDTICKYCYGHLYDINNDLFSVGTLAA